MALTFTVAIKPDTSSSTNLNSFLDLAMNRTETFAARCVNSYYLLGSITKTLGMCCTQVKSTGDIYYDGSSTFSPRTVKTVTIKHGSSTVATAVAYSMSGNVQTKRIPAFTVNNSNPNSYDLLANLSLVTGGESQYLHNARGGTISFSFSIPDDFI